MDDATFAAVTPGRLGRSPHVPLAPLEREARSSRVNWASREVAVAVGQRVLLTISAALRPAAFLLRLHQQVVVETGVVDEVLPDVRIVGVAVDDGIDIRDSSDRLPQRCAELRGAPVRVGGVDERSVSCGRTCLRCEPCRSLRHDRVAVGVASRSSRGRLLHPLQRVPRPEGSGRGSPGTARSLNPALEAHAAPQSALFLRVGVLSCTKLTARASARALWRSGSSR